MEKQDTRPQLTEEELKAIGEIEIGPAKHEIFLNNHYKKVLLGILVGAIGAGIGIAYFSNKQDERDLAASMIVTSLSSEGNYMATELPAIKTQYAHSPSAATSQLIIALSMIEGNQVESGLKELQRIAIEATDITIASRAAAAIANYQMAEGNNELATTAWQQVANMSINPYSALAYMSLGDIANSAGDKDKARNFYQSAKEKCATSSLVNAKDIEMRLLLVDVDAPKPVMMTYASAGDSSIDTTIDTKIDTSLDLDSSMDTLPPLTPTE